MKNFVIIMLSVLIFACGYTKNNADLESKYSENNCSIHPIDKAETECISKVYSTYDISQCSYKAMNSWYKEIDKYLKLLKPVAPRDDYANILKSQTDWEKYQESEFEATNVVLNEQGTMFQNTAAGLKANIVKERALELKKLYDILVYR